jgi:hypothetical protein
VDNITLGKVMLVKDLVDPQGNPARPHRAICLTTKDEHANGSPIIAVVVSSQLRLAATDCMVVMDKLWQKGGHPQTGFDRRCAAICCWVVKVEEESILRYHNVVYGSVLQNVLDCVARAQARKKSGTSATSPSTQS